MNRHIFIFLLVLVSRFAFSQPQLQWSKTWGSGSLQDDIPAKLCTDYLGNIYVTGGRNLNTSGNGRHAGTIKYNSNGDSLFARTFFAAGDTGTSGTDMILDDSLNVYVAGIWALKYNKFGTLIWSKRINQSYSKVKFNNLGNLVYSGIEGSKFVVYQFNTNGDSLFKGSYSDVNIIPQVHSGFVVDNENNIVLTGVMSNTTTYYDMITIKFSPNCNFLWARTYNGSAYTYDGAFGIVTDSIGNIYTTGKSTGTNGIYNFFTIKYDKLGTTIWQRREKLEAGGATDMKMDREHNMIITGTTGNDLYTTIKITSNGDSLWSQTTQGAPGTPESKVILDSLGNVYVGCYIRNSNNYSDFHVIKYSKNGLQLWDAIYPGSGIRNHNLRDLILDNFGNVIVTGSGAVQSSAYDYTTVKFSQVTGIKQSGVTQLQDFPLSQNYPNPFNPYSVLSFKLQVSSFIELKLYDAAGKLVKILDNGYKRAGNYEVTLNAENYPSGIYYYSLYTDGILKDTKKAVLIK